MDSNNNNDVPLESNNSSTCRGNCSDCHTGGRSTREDSERNCSNDTTVSIETSTSKSVPRESNNTPSSNETYVGKETASRQNQFNLDVRNEVSNTEDRSNILKNQSKCYYMTNNNAFDSQINFIF